MNGMSRIGALPVVVVLLLLLTLGLVAQARSLELAEPVRPDPAQDERNGVVGLSISQAEQEAALAYWTRETIAAAEAMEIPVDYGPAVVDASVLDEAAHLELEAADSPGSIGPGAAAPDADVVARAAFPLDWVEVEEVVDETAAADPAPAAPGATSGTGQVFSSYVANRGAMQRIYPHRWIGKLSFRQPNGNQSFCSGTSISGNVMLTAAHCLFDTTSNTWFTNFVFTPAYRNGNAPYGNFAATNCWVPVAWVNLTGNFAINSWSRHDVGVCKMGKNSANETLNDAVGWMGIQWDVSYTRHFHNLGYPLRNFNNASIPNAGQLLRTCVAESFQQTTNTLGMGCNWGGGISGGPWMTGYVPYGLSGWATSVNSGLFYGTRNMYGARFTSHNIAVLCDIAGC